MAAAKSALGGQSTQLGYWECDDLDIRRGTQGALDRIDVQRPRHVWVDFPKSSKSPQRQQMILKNLIWILPRGATPSLGSTRW